MHRPLFSSDLLNRSAIPFCSGLCGTVVRFWVPKFEMMTGTAAGMYSRPFTERTNMGVVLVQVVTDCNAFSISSATSSFVRVKMTNVLRDVTSAKVPKYVSPCVYFGYTGPPTSVKITVPMGTLCAAL